jgi:trehalose-6-phosphate synthase
MAYYLTADVAVVTPLRDGMNLVAKEFVTTKSAVKRPGALVLSEFAGAAAELTDAVQCNPYDPVGCADAIEAAIEMDDDEKRKRLSTMAVHIENNDTAHWADQLLRTAEARHPVGERR